VVRIGAIFVAGAAAGFIASAALAAQIRIGIGPARLVSTSFGYAVAYKTVEGRYRARTTVGLFVYVDGGWRNVTPPRLTPNTIDDVAFIDRLHGWVAGYNCAEASVYLYRTSDGGRSWQSLGKPASHSCGGGPTFLSFADTKHGWMEPVSPNGPGGQMFRTDDGGRTWTLLGGPEAGTPSLPCLAPIQFVSPSVGWMARCGGHVFSTHDGGRRWGEVAIRVPRAPKTQLFDLPRFFSRNGIEAATLGDRAGAVPADVRARAVAFAVSADGGRTWSVRSVRRIASCVLQNGPGFYPASWPASVAGPRVWWIVYGSRRAFVQVTGDAGRHWQTVTAHGLPYPGCWVTSISAANSRVAWAVVRYDTAYDSALYETGDGGRTWRRVTLLR
jgi:photosystem II stability/assembly factor-like uncharacterized protein